MSNQNSFKGLLHGLKSTTVPTSGNNALSLTVLNKMILAIPIVRGAKYIHTLNGAYKIRKNGRMILVLAPGTEHAKSVRVTPMRLWSRYQD